MYMVLNIYGHHFDKETQIISCIALQTLTVLIFKKATVEEYPVAFSVLDNNTFII